MKATIVEAPCEVVNGVPEWRAAESFCFAIGHADALGRYREIDLQEDLDLAQTHWEE